MKTERTAISEQWFHQFWQDQVLDGSALQTENGKSIRVLYPGRPNDLRGPDFRDAVIEEGTEKRQGDVELHLLSGDWRTHRHHLDRHYNRVILHVVMRHNTRQGTILENGEEIPVLALGNPETGKDSRGPRRRQRSMPCSGAGSGHRTERLLAVLDEAGTERFRRKAAMLAHKIRSDGEAETLYREMMEAMGYAANKAPFRELAEQCPLERIAEAADGVKDRKTVIRACLFGSAGFLYEEFQPRLTAAGITDRQRRTLTEYWQQIDGSVTIPIEHWQLFRIRPNNSPFVRLAAISTILARTGLHGFLPHLKSIIETGCMGTDVKVLEDNLAALSIAKNTGTDRGSAVPLGKERARAIVVNVLLPFGAAHYELDTGKVLATYRSCRKAPENSLERHMREQFGLEKRDIKTVVQQQGLIHIYKTLCTQGKCDDCPVRTFS